MKVKVLTWRGLAHASGLALAAASGAALAQDQSDPRAREGYTSYSDQVVKPQRQSAAADTQQQAQPEGAQSQSEIVVSEAGQSEGRQQAEQSASTVEPSEESSADVSAVEPQQLEEMQGKSLVNQKGEELGEISQIVRDKQDQSLKAVVASGGFLGMGAKKVVVPLEQIQVQQDKATLSSGMSQQELQQMASFNQQNYDPVQVGQRASPPRG